MFETSPYTSYIVLSDFDALPSSYIFPPHSSLIGIGSSMGDFVKYANGVRYYDNGKSVFSARNDSRAKSFGVPYITVSNMDEFVPKKVISHGISLPFSQRIFLYTLLGVLVILAILL